MSLHEQDMIKKYKVEYKNKKNKKLLNSTSIFIVTWVFVNAMVSSHSDQHLFNLNEPDAKRGLLISFKT